jgi:predicted ribosome quality control (RQC) complex YloA/Tae2 family protein
MDSIFLFAIVDELSATLTGAAVSKIHQVGPCDLVLRLWTGRDNLRLLLSTAPGASRLHLTTARYPNPAAPPRFCQLLRARLKRLLAVRQEPGERIVHLEFAGEQQERWILVAELIGGRSNLMLVDRDGLIVDGLQRNGGEGRPVLPGRRYRPPGSAGRSNLLERPPEIPKDRSFRSWLLDEVWPMTPLAAADLTAAVQAGLTPEKALEGFRRRLLERDFRPGTGIRNDRPVLFALPPEYLELETLRFFGSPSAAADAFYAGAAIEELFGAGRSEMSRVVKKARTRLEKRLKNIAAEEDKARGAERQRELGDLLLANLHRLQRGMTEAKLEDWYASPPGPVSIPLDPALSPRENAERYFRRHRKGRRALEHVERRRCETRDELAWLAGVQLALEEAESEMDLEPIREELAGAGLLQRRSEPGRRRSGDSPPSLRRAMSPGGYQIIWGRNNRSNDLVSREQAGAGDLWFHAHNLPGCHLVLKRGTEKGPIPEEDIRYAAAIAAAHSRGKNDTKVEVMVAAGDQVRKPKGARPGLVTVGRYRTLMVAPRIPEEQDLEGG